MLKNRLISYSYFVGFNSLLAIIVSIQYFYGGNPWYFISSPIDWLFIITSHISYVVLLTFLIGLIVIPTLFLPKKLSIIFQVVFVMIGITLLFIDGRLFINYHVHLNNMPIKAVANEIAVELFTINKLKLLIGYIILCITEFIFASWLFNSKNIYRYKLASKCCMLFFLCLVCSQTIYHFVYSDKQQKLVASNLYKPILLVKNNSYGNDYLIQEFKHKITKNILQHDYKVNYPLKPLQKNQVENLPNIIIIGIDAWRADCFNETDTPNMWQFAQKGKIFTNHRSGGNHTKAGIFSLFYGVPPMYKHIFTQYSKPSVFINRLDELNYQANFFAYNDNINWYIELLNEVPKIYFPKGSTRAELDNSVTNDWLQWHNNLDKSKPYFSFIFYGSAHGYDFPDNYSTKYKPQSGKGYKDIAKELGIKDSIGGYKTCLHYIDSLAKKIIDGISQEELANTIVIITADHGCEFDDYGQNFFGYESNFTDAQIKVPFAIIGAKLTDNLQYKTNDLTTHYDVVPTLMKNFLGVNNDTQDYSIGVDLLAINSQPRTWSFASYIHRNAMYCGIVEDKTIFQWFPSGFYQFLNKQNQPIFNQTINKQRLAEAVNMMTRFLK